MKNNNSFGWTSFDVDYCLFFRLRYAFIGINSTAFFPKPVNASLYSFAVSIVFYPCILSSGKCKYADCTLSEWSDWSSAALTTGQCGKEKRTRDFIAEEKFTFSENCDGLTTSCPASQEETRTMCMFLNIFLFLIYRPNIFTTE